MGFLAGWMWVYLAMAALLGFLLAQFLGQTRFARQRADFERTWLLRVRQAEQERDTKIAQLTSEIEEHRIQIPTLEKSLAERSLLIADLEVDVERWKDQIKPMEEKISLLSDSSNTESSQLAEWEQLIETAESERNKAQQELAKLRSDFDQMRERHNSANADAQAVRKELEAQQAESKTIVTQLGVAADEVTDMRKAMEAVSNDAEEAKKLSLNLHKLQSDHAELAGRYEEAMGDLEAQTNIHEADREELDEMRVAVVDAQRELKDLREQLESSSQATHQGEGSQVRMQSEIDQLQLVVKQHKDEQSSLRSQLEDAVNSAKAGERHANEAKQLARQLDQLQSASTETNARSKDHQAATQKLTAQLADSNKARELAGKQIASLAEQLRVLEQQKTDFDTLNARAAASAEAHEAAQKQLDELRLTVERSEQSRRAIERKMTDDHHRELHAVDTERRELREALNMLQQRSAGLQASTDAQDALAEKYSELQNKYNGLERSHQRLRTDHEACIPSDEHRETLGALESKITKLGDALAQKRNNKSKDSSVAAANKTTGKPRVKAKKSAQKASKKNAGVKPEPIDHQPDWLLETRPDEIDDLKKIWGVGPVMEKTMNGLGIYLFRQVAALRKKDIEWIASHINTFPDRIERDDWVEQAATLRREKYGR